MKKTKKKRRRSVRLPGSGLHIGGAVWLVDAITRKKDGAVVGATISDYHVVSFDDCMIAVVRAENDGEEENIFDLVSLRFVSRQECHRTRADAEQARENIVPAR